MLFAVYDTETTGLPFHFKGDLDKQPRIIEFAGIITDGEKIIDEIEFIINPGIAIEDIITKITGLTNSDLEDKPDFSFYIPKVAAYFKQANAVVAHNLSFDKGMVQYDLERRNLTLSDVNWPKLELCTVEQTMPQFGRRMKLIELYRHYVGEYEQKHRALDDVMRLHEVCQKIGLYDALKESNQ
jgi:DNA polymerase III alpha subunit (gram-positive type)